MIEPDVIEQDIVEHEVIELEVVEPEVIELEAFEPEVIDIEVIELEAIEQEVIDIEVIELEVVEQASQGTVPKEEYYPPQHLQDDCLGEGASAPVRPVTGLSLKQMSQKLVQVDNVMQPLEPRDQPTTIAERILSNNDPLQTPEKLEIY